MRRAFKYRLYPSRAQETLLQSWLDLCREIYNAGLEERREAWKVGVRIGYPAQSRQLPQIKRIRPEVDRVQRGQTPGYPRFQSRDRYRSLTWPQENAFSLLGRKRLRLSGIGEVRIKLHRALEGRPKTCTLKVEAGKWYAILSCDQVPARPYPPATAEVGIDLGLHSFATLSSGEPIDNPRWYRKTEERLARAQQELSRKKPGSQRRAKARLRVARLHAKARREREDFQHKQAYQLVRKHALIAVEDLTIDPLVQRSSRGLSKSILDAAWGSFLWILACKAEEAGRRFVKVAPRGTSSQCSGCGAVRSKTLRERIHVCPCGLRIDRDLNAAINILRLGRSLQAPA